MGPIRTGQDDRRERRDARRGEVVLTAQVGHGAHLEAYDLAVTGYRRLDVVDLTPTVHHVEKVFAAHFHPAHRPPQLHGEVGSEHVFGGEVDLGAEAAADVRGDDTHAVFGQTEDIGELRAHGVRELGAGPEGQLTRAAVVASRGATCLHRHWQHPRIHEATLDDLYVWPSECSLDGSAG